MFEKVYFLFFSRGGSGTKGVSGWVGVGVGGGVRGLRVGRGQALNGWTLTSYSNDFPLFLHQFLL